MIFRKYNTEGNRKGCLNQNCLDYYFGTGVFGACKGCLIGASCEAPVPHKVENKFPLPKTCIYCKQHLFGFNDPGVAAYEQKHFNIAKKIAKQITPMRIKSASKSNKAMEKWLEAINPLIQEFAKSKRIVECAVIEVAIFSVNVQPGIGLFNLSGSIEELREQAKSAWKILELFRSFKTTSFEELLETLDKTDETVPGLVVKSGYAFPSNQHWQEVHYHGHKLFPIKKLDW